MAQVTPGRCCNCGKPTERNPRRPREWLRYCSQRCVSRMAYNRHVARQERLKVRADGRRRRHIRHCAKCGDTGHPTDQCEQHESRLVRCPRYPACTAMLWRREIALHLASDQCEDPRAGVPNHRQHEPSHRAHLNQLTQSR